MIQAGVALFAIILIAGAVALWPVPALAQLRAADEELRRQIAKLSAAAKLTHAK
jgi:hypothetical protein